MSSPALITRRSQMLPYALRLQLKTCYGLLLEFFFSSRRRHTRLQGDWSSDVCSSDLVGEVAELGLPQDQGLGRRGGVAVLEAQTRELGERAVVQLERRPRPGKILDRGMAAAVPGVVQHEVSLAERAALRVLAREPDRRSLGEERREGQGLRVGPLDLTVGEGGPAPLQLLLQLGNDREAVGHEQQLLVQRREQGGGHGGVRLRP